MVYGYVQKFLWNRMETDVDAAMEQFKILYKFIVRMITEEVSGEQSE